MKAPAELEQNTFHFKPIFLLTLTIFMNFIGRGLFSPLLPILEREFGVNHARASTLFFIISLSMSISMIFSGFLAKTLKHRGLIILYGALFGISFFICAFSPSFTFLQLSAAFLGFSSGLYAPSGLASISNLAGERHWGKALALHEMGPTLGLLCAPLMVGLLSPILSWRTILGIIGMLVFLICFIYVFRGRGGDFHGEPPNFGNLKYIFTNPSLMILTAYFILAAGSAAGVYAILPTFLISDRGFDPSLVNTVVGLSRGTGIIFVVGAGFMVDRFGIKPFLALTLGFSGLFALGLGSFHGSLLLGTVFFQPMIISGFFPVANTAITVITRPQTRNVAFSVIIPFAIAIGGGVTPSILGFLGEKEQFTTGFLALGVLTLAAILLLPLLKVKKPE